MKFLGLLLHGNWGQLRRTKYQLSFLTPATIFIKHVDVTQANGAVSSQNLKLTGEKSPFLFKLLSNYL